MLPAPVSRLLKDFSSEFAEQAELAGRVTQVDGRVAPMEQRTRACILHDGYGQIHVIIPESGLVDLERLNIELGRDLRTLPLQEQSILLNKVAWQDIPVLPHLNGLPVIVDPLVYEMATVYMPSDKPGKVLQMEQALFAGIMKRARAKSLSCIVRLPQISINHNQPQQDLDQIKKTIQTFTSLRIQKRLEDTLEMPPLPETARRIIKLRVNPDAGVSDLADIVETDPSLAAQVVSWASSSFYAAPGKIRSVQDAIVRVLGFDLVMNLAMGLSLGRTLNLPKDAAEGYTSYWEQAVWTATLCGALTSAIPKEKRPELGLAYLAGLLHNYGYLVLAHVFPPHFSLVCRSVEVNRQLDPENCEHYLLGVTREQIGSNLMRVWNMPEEVVTAMRFQKNPYYMGDHALYSNLLFLVVQLLRQKGIGDGPVQPIPQSVWERLNLEPDCVRDIVQELMVMSDELQTLAKNMQNFA
jgi:HD-like signal output (HDOD) protein/prolyl-tRNA editing enzyme YbaK/EbsC (Cys-tRNA(Pro) deacylase)